MHELFRAAALVTGIVALVACYPQAESVVQEPITCDSQRHGARLQPPSGVWFGVNLDLARDSPAKYSARLQRRPSVYASFSPVPIDSVNGVYIDQAVEMLLESGGMLLLTLEPHLGLESITDAEADKIAARLSRYNARGVLVLLRFAHEMNGSWYPWSQQPSAYVAAFNRVARAVHRHAPGSAMLWAPNYGGGYPFALGEYQAQSASIDFPLLDTDKDGLLTAGDDPYAPYYPGDDSVDWVGMSLYHWGAKYPWGTNAVAEPAKFERMLEGKYHGSVGDERGLPNFYHDYGEARGKPVGVFETAAFHAPSARGADAMSVKASWWQQVYEPGIPQRFPRLKMINWFEWDKHEVEVDARVDWTATIDPTIRGAFRDALPEWLRYAGDIDFCRPLGGP